MPANLDDTTCSRVSLLAEQTEDLVMPSAALYNYFVNTIIPA